MRTTQWLEHRFRLFERYCLPSVAKQTCQDFTWIVLFDSSTPERFESRIVEYQEQCPQLVPVFVEPCNGRFFASVFREEVLLRQAQGPTRVLTTYLDNDDVLDVRFVEDLQRRASTLEGGTFISYDEGYQLFTDYNYVMRIRYPRNHFVSVVEDGDASEVKTIYGYGSHYYIEKIHEAIIERVVGQPMWCEVIHDRNMGNDAYFLRAWMVRDRELLRRDFALDESVQFGFGLYLFRFLPRYARTLVRRIGYWVFGRHW